MAEKIGFTLTSGKEDTDVQNIIYTAVTFVLKFHNNICLRSAVCTFLSCNIYNPIFSLPPCLCWTLTLCLLQTVFSFTQSVTTSTHLSLVNVWTDVIWGLQKWCRGNSLGVYVYVCVGIGFLMFVTSPSCINVLNYLSEPRMSDYVFVPWSMSARHGKKHRTPVVFWTSGLQR